MWNPMPDRDYTPSEREAFIAGVETALAGTMSRLTALDMALVKKWCEELKSWSKGPPPPSPFKWR
jgi:hypothetical protein